MRKKIINKRWLNLKYRKVLLGEQDKDNLSNGSKISEEFSANPLIDDSNKLGNGSGSYGVDCPDTNTEIDLSGIPDGNCIVNLRYFLAEVISAFRHKISCDHGKLIIKQLEKKGLKTELKVKCNKCNWEKRIKGEPECPATSVKEYISSFTDQTQVAFSEKKSSLKGCLNSKAVWGAMGSGGGYSTLCEFFGVLGVKPMSRIVYSRMERQLGNAWMNSLSEILLENGREALKSAIHDDRYKEDSYWTKVICDGGWNKRSKGHDYSAKGCVAVIIDAFSKKLLYVGIKNKYCYICFSSANAKVIPKDHFCFLNYNGNSRSMETDILVEGFRSSEEMHGLQFLEFIGDGDSSVFYKLKQSVSYGSNIRKHECANHVTKNYTAHLYNLCKNKKGLYTKCLPRGIIQQLTKNLRGAIKINSENNGTAEELKILLKRGPYHVFGNHTKCDSGCPKIAELAVNSKIEDRWNNFPLQVFEDVMTEVDIVCRKAEQLRNDATTNLAESYMSVVAKFIGEKQISRSKRGSYHARVHGASLAYNSGPKWHQLAWKNIFGLSPSSVTKKYCNKTAKLRVISKRNLTSYYSALGGKHVAKLKNRNYNFGNRDYGPNCNKPDMTSDEMNLAIQKYTDENLKLDFASISCLFNSTKGQSKNDTWVEERSKRITSSYFHRIATRKNSTRVAPIVKQIRNLGPRFCSALMKKGLDLEVVALEAYENKFNLKVVKGDQIGLSVHPQYQYLAASVDGLLPNGTPIEIKTVHNIPEFKTIYDVAQSKNLVKAFFLELSSESLQLKKITGISPRYKANSGYWIKWYAT
ncbi:uncharacterized protein LOC136036116 [Artemia franciscana]|uniref:uncharacterized protein LOC136036116 n=1 Tax=Artemia franciscana TaxID=6661 RepID=UPI0032D9B75E